MPVSLRRWDSYIERDGNVEMWARAQLHSSAFPELPCNALLGSFSVPRVTGMVPHTQGGKGDPAITLGSSGCVGLVCLDRGPGMEMSSPQSESQGSGYSESQSRVQDGVRPGSAGQ